MVVDESTFGKSAAALLACRAGGNPVTPTEG